MGPVALLAFWMKACWGFFRPENSWRLRPGLNPWTRVLKGSTLPLDHWSRSCNVLVGVSLLKLLLHWALHRKPYFDCSCNKMWLSGCDSLLSGDILYVIVGARSEGVCVAVQGSGGCAGHQQLLQQAAPRGCSPEHQGECDSLQPYVPVETCYIFYIVNFSKSKLQTVTVSYRLLRVNLFFPFVIQWSYSHKCW